MQMMFIILMLGKPKPKNQPFSDGKITKINKKARPAILEEERGVG